MIQTNFEHLLREREANRFALIQYTAFAIFSMLAAAFME